MFVDEVEIRVADGAGGRGCIAFRREKFERILPVMQSFADELARRRPALQSVLDAGDVAAVGRDTHSIKGSALTFGALVLGAAARRANDASRAGDAATALDAAREGVELMPLTRDVVLRRIARGTEDSKR